MENSLSVTYNGNAIHTASASGAATLKTAGKYLTGDIGIAYTVDAGGTLEEKSVSLAENGTTVVLPAAGVDGFSKVSITVAVPLRCPHADPTAALDFVQMLADGFSFSTSAVEGE